MTMIPPPAAYWERYQRADNVAAVRWTGDNMAEVLSIWHGLDVAVNSFGNPVVYCGAGHDPIVAELGDWVARSTTGPEVWTDNGFRAAHWAEGLIRRTDPVTLTRGNPNTDDRPKRTKQ